MKAVLRILLERLNESIGLLELECSIVGAVSPEVQKAAEAIRRRFDELKWGMGREQL